MTVKHVLCHHTRLMKLTVMMILMMNISDYLKYLMEIISMIEAIVPKAPLLKDLIGDQL